VRLAPYIFQWANYAGYYYNVSRYGKRDLMAQNKNVEFLMSLGIINLPLRWLKILESITLNPR